MVQNVTKLHNEWKGEQERVAIVMCRKNKTHVETKYTTCIAVGRTCTV